MNKPSRRAVVRTGVWAVPAVATVAVAPAFATSCADCVTITGLAGGCKLPGNPRGKSYAIELNVHSDNPNTLVVDSITVQATGAPVVQVAACPTTFAIPSGDSVIVIYVSDLSNSQQKAATVVINYENGQGTQQFSFSIDGFHPFGGDNCPKDLTPPASC